MRLMVLAIAWVWSLPGGASELAGTVVPPYPDGLSSDMGSCIPDDEDICAYSIATLNSEDGSVLAVLAQRFLRHVDGEAIWEIVDSIDAPDRAEGQFWAFEECRVDRMIDASAVGLVTARDAGGWLETEETVWAVRFDAGSGQLSELDPRHVKCVLPGS